MKTTPGAMKSRALVGWLWLGGEKVLGSCRAAEDCLGTMNARHTVRASVPTSIGIVPLSHFTDGEPKAQARQVTGPRFIGLTITPGWSFLFNYDTFALSRVHNRH